MTLSSPFIGISLENQAAVSHGCRSEGRIGSFGGRRQGKGATCAGIFTCVLLLTGRTLLVDLLDHARKATAAARAASQSTENGTRRDHAAFRAIQNGSRPAAQVLVAQAITGTYDHRACYL